MAFLLHLRKYMCLCLTGLAEPKEKRNDGVRSVSKTHCSVFVFASHKLRLARRNMDISKLYLNILKQ